MVINRATTLSDTEVQAIALLVIPLAGFFRENLPQSIATALAHFGRIDGNEPQTDDEQTDFYAIAHEVERVTRFMRANVPHTRAERPDTSPRGRACAALLESLDEPFGPHS